MKNAWAILAIISLALFSTCQGITWNEIENETYCDCSGNICNMNGSQTIQAFLEEAGFTVYPHATGNNVIAEATRSFGNVTQVINIRFDSLPMVSSVFALPNGNNAKTRPEVQEMKNLSAGDLWVWEGRSFFCSGECSQRVLVVVKRFDVNETVNAGMISDAANDITAYVGGFRELTGLPLEQADTGEWYLPVDEREYS